MLVLSQGAVPIIHTLEEKDTDTPLGHLKWGFWELLWHKV